MTKRKKLKVILPYDVCKVVFATKDMVEFEHKGKGWWLLLDEDYYDAATRGWDRLVK